MKQVLLSGAWKQIVSARFMVGGAWKRITRCQIYDDGWKIAGDYTPPLSVSASPASVFGVNGPTGSTTVTPAGGTGPFTYSWALVSGSGTAVNPTSATTNFDGPQGSAVFRCNVNDSSGQSASADVNASFIAIQLPF